MDWLTLFFASLTFERNMLALVVQGTEITTTTMYMCK